MANTLFILGMEKFLKLIEDNTWIGFTGYRYHWSQLNDVHSDDLNNYQLNNFEYCS